MNRQCIKLVIILLSAVLLVSAFPYLPGDGSLPVEEPVPTEESFSDQQTIVKLTEPLPPVGILYCVEEDKILWSAQEDKEVSPASLTKLMTVLTALENSTTDAVFEAGGELFLLEKNSSLCGLHENDRLTLYDLICGMLITSGNDAAYTIAANIGRFQSGENDISDLEAVKFFCGLMNTYAEKLGAENTLFINPDGMDNDFHYTTVSDMLKIILAALDNDIVRNIVSKPEISAETESGKKFLWKNSNRLLHKEDIFYYPEAIGIKTGTTFNAGHCLAAAAQIKGKTYIAVAMGCPEDDDRYLSVINMFEYAKNYIE